MQACSRRAGRAGIVAVVLERQRHRLRHDGVRGKVHDGIDLMLRQEPRHQRMIADIADDQLAGGDGLPEALGQDYRER